MILVIHLYFINITCMNTLLETNSNRCMKKNGIPPLKTKWNYLKKKLLNFNGYTHLAINWTNRSNWSAIPASLFHTRTVISCQRSNRWFLMDTMYIEPDLVYAEKRSHNNRSRISRSALALKSPARSAAAAAAV